MLDTHTKARYYRKAEELIDGLVLPDAEQEAVDPEGADNAYKAVTQFLLPRTRDKEKLGLLFAENVNYGFRRNLLGLKPMAIGIILLSIGILCWKSWDQLSVGKIPAEPQAPLLIGAIILLLAWIFYVTERRVHDVGADYARQLLMSLDLLPKT